MSTLKKINIIKKNTEFNSIINEGKPYKNKYYSIYVINKKEKYYRIGIAIPKKTGIAVIRNKIKRQIKDIIDKSSLNNLNFDCIIIVRRNILDLNYEYMKKYLLELLSRINEENKYE